MEPRDDTTVPFGRADIPADHKTRRVTALFQDIAADYDLMNDLMSLGLQRLWKRHLLNMIRGRPGGLALDVAGGTGDIALALAARDFRVTVCDPASRMLETGRRRERHSPGNRYPITWLAASGEHLPLADDSFHLCTNSFGLRNITRPGLALSETYRVLRPLGRLLVMEFDAPDTPLVRRIYNSHRDHVLPALGAVVARNRAAYSYLAESIRRFASETSIPGLLAAAGFSRIRTTRLAGGIVAIHDACKIPGRTQP